MIIASDTGQPRSRAFVQLATAEPHYVGAEPPADAQGQPSRIPKIENRLAVFHGVPTPAHIAQYGIPLGIEGDINEAISQYLSRLTKGQAWTVQVMNLPPGSYFPRMARPHHQHAGGFPAPFLGADYAHAKAGTGTQISLITNRIRHCFQVVSPVEKNFDAFGAEFRSILILAATEFEAQCKAIMRANGYTPKGGEHRWTTKDFFLLEAALRLADYALAFPEYPWLDPIAPFRTWSAASPTASLPWYEAYNLTKHDREAHEGKATMMRALEAIAAVVVIGLAQFGISFLRNAERWRDMFAVQDYPRWSIGDTHGAAYSDGVPIAGQSINYPF